MRRITKLLSAFTAIIVLLTIVQISPTVASTGSGIKQRLDGAVVLYVGSPLAYVNNTETRIDTGNPSVMPVIKNSRTLLPVRFISESLGAGVQWDAATLTVTITQGLKRVKLVLGSSSMMVGNSEVKLDAAAESINGRTFIPLRPLVEALGRKVFYDRGLIIVSDRENIFDPTSEKAMLDEVISMVNKPPVIGSSEALKSLLSSTYSSQDEVYIDDIAPMTGVAKKEMRTAEASEAKADSSAQSAKASDYSTTNVQVQGVDEADVVKTDGEYIYQVNKNRIVVARAYPADNLELVSTVNFQGGNFTPQEIYIDSKHMAVIGTSYAEIQVYKPEAGVEPKIYPPPYGLNTTKAIIFDISDRKNIKQLREVELEGGYVSSRKIGSTLYLISNKNIWRWVIQRGFDEEYLNRVLSEELKGYDREALKKYLDMMALPSYRDTSAGNDFVQVDYSRMHFFPDTVLSNYMTVAAVNLDKMDRKANIATYLGAGQNIYASLQNLYVAVTNYDRNANGAEKRLIAPDRGTEANTLVYKFSLTDDAVTYLCKGGVPGTVLNQFSMDESGKSFRIATTGGSAWRTGEFTSRNNVYVLDELLNITGRLEDIAPGERIYSVRFMGDRAYVVTFKTVDPLFVIDLEDPANPRVLGALKIPGYSDYLHPYDETHIIGFGKDTVEIKGNAYYLGMKIAIFDVSDVTSPKEMFSEKIGDRGTESELLHNHKALLFSKDKNLLAFPVTLMEVENNSEKLKEGFPQYGQFKYQGAYVYGIDLVKGFSLKGRITHLSQEDYAKAGSYWYDSDKNVQRILYINDTLYTLSNSMIKANGLSDLKEKKALQIP